MTATLEGRLKVLVYTDEVSNNNPQSRLLDISERLSDEMDEFQPLLIQIPNGTIDQVISMNGINASMLSIFSDQQLLIKLNGSSNNIKAKDFYISETEINDIKISNSSGEDANVRISFGK